MACHHGDYDPQTVEAVLVTAADALSAARPGRPARDARDLRQAAREARGDRRRASRACRRPSPSRPAARSASSSTASKITDERGALAVARTSPRRSRRSCTYPGQIKVTVIRETRGRVEYRAVKSDEAPLRRRRHRQARAGRRCSDLLPGLVDQRPGRLRGRQRRERGRRLRRHPGRPATSSTTLPIDCFTCGQPHLGQEGGRRAPRPARRRCCGPPTIPSGNPGRGVHVGETAAGIPVAVLNLEGQVFMKQRSTRPFRGGRPPARGARRRGQGDLRRLPRRGHQREAGDGLLSRRPGLSAVLGTHTHVPTADERILPGGTALLTDVGMTGPYESIIGFRADKVLQRFLLQTPSRSRSPSATCAWPPR